MQHCRTDLAREARDLAGSSLEGIEQVTERRDGLSVERITICTEAAAQRLGKPARPLCDDRCGRHPRARPARVCRRVPPDCGGARGAFGGAAARWRRDGDRPWKPVCDAGCAGAGDGGPYLCDAAHPYRRAGTGAERPAGRLGHGARRAGDDRHGNGGNCQGACRARAPRRRDLYRRAGGAQYGPGQPYRTAERQRHQPPVPASATCATRCPGRRWACR